MANKEGENSVDDFAQRICKHVLERKQFEQAFQSFLTKVDLPDDGKDSGYKLQDIHPTYKYRHDCLSKFVAQKEAEHIKVASEQLGEFITQLKNAANSPLEVENSFSHLQEQKSQPFDLFEQNIKLEGVVVRKCEKRLRASVLTKKPDHHSGQGFILNELVISIEDAHKAGGEFQLKVGDIVELTKCRRKEGMAIDAEVIKCLSRTESEMGSFLEHLLKCLQNEGSTAVVTELTRCQAFWNYVLENCDTSMVPQILEITDKICSNAQMQMSHTIKRVVEGLAKSVFFKSVLPEFIHRMTKENNNRVQRVLEHVMKVCPYCGPTLLPMAMDLARGLVDTSCDVENTAEDVRTGCHCAVEFLGKLSSIIAVEVPGAREDLKAVHWRKHPLIPVKRELHEDNLKTNDLPVIIKKGSYPSEEEYLDTYFTLLREECFYKLKKGISDFVMNRSQFDSKDMMMYRIVLKAVSTLHENSPAVMSIALEYKALHSKDDSELDPSSWFLVGSLLCISMDNSYETPVWATVEKHVAEQGIVWITLCGDGANVMNEAQFIIKMQEITDRNDEAFMAESQTFYLSFAPAMDVLQHKDCVPFKEFIVHPDENAQSMEPAGYINKIKQQPNWEIIFKNENLPDHINHQGELSDYSLLKEFEQIRLNSHWKAQLDETQLAAVELALKKKLALIQGPPGTGKSFVGVALVRLLLSMNVPQDHGPILVITYKNHALNHFLEECLKNIPSHNVKIVRVGRLTEGASMELEKCLLREVGRRWPDVLYKQKRKLTGQLWAMQPQVREASRKLRESCIFSAETFLKEASKDQIKYLLMDNKHKTVDGANVEDLLNKQDQDHRNNTCLRGLVEDALKDWLPSQEEFDSFAREGKQSPEASGRTYLDTTETALKSKKGSEEPNSKGDQERENPNDLREPSVEQNERLLAMDEECPDEEDLHIMEAETPVSQDHRQMVNEMCTRKLVCIDDTRVRNFRSLLNASKVWDLRPDERVQLAYVFQSSYRERASEEFLAISQAYVQIHHQLKELRNQHDIEVMKRCHVIGMTVTGATIRANLLADIKPSVMIVEEAAEILEGQLVAVLPPSVQHLIMIGDHKQLRPTVHFQKLKRHHHFDLSMFERLINCQLPYKQLGFQCRMRDEFVDLLRRLNIYPELKTNEELVRENVPPQCVDKGMYFWTHTKWESNSKNSHSKLNEAEARKITEVAETLCGEGKIPPSKITVLCSYRGQVTEIKKRFLRSQVAALPNIAVATIDSFQGQENDIILISLVRSSQGGTIGYLSSLNRLCVTISRARCGLYLFGNHVHLANRSKKGWKIVSDTMRKKQCLGHKFPFRSSGQFKSEVGTETQSEGRGNLTVINAQNVIFSGDNSVNTINTTPTRNETDMDKTGNSKSATTPPQHLQMPISPSDKTPEHNPKSPPPGAGYPAPRLEGSDTDAAESRLSCVVDTPTMDDEFMKSIQESAEGAEKKKGLKDHPESRVRHVYKEGDFKEFIKDQPLPGKAEGADGGGTKQEDHETLSEGKPLQEDASSNVESESWKEEVLSTQETMPAGKGPFEETGKAERLAVEETRQIKEAEPVHEELSGSKTVDEGTSFDPTTESIKEEALPAKETMAAGKGPLEETCFEVSLSTDEQE